MMKMKMIKFNKDLIAPTRAHYNDAGLDCYALEQIIIPPFGKDEYDPKTGTIKKDVHIVTVPLGFGLNIPDGYQVVIKPRSSMNKKVITQIGTIDSGYKGEISAVLVNLTKNWIKIERGDRICQIVVEPVIYADLVDELVDNRDTGGFGSTGR